VQASLRVRDLLIASWEADRQDVQTALPKPLEVASLHGRFLLSLAGFRVEGGRIGRIPVPPYAQLNVRTNVTWKDEPAVFFFAARVTAGGLPGAILGAPFRYARLRVEEGAVSAPGRGVSVRYRTGGPVDPGPLANVGLFENDGLCEFRIERGEAAWHQAELVEPPRADFLYALGFHPQGEPTLLYSPRSSFVVQVRQRGKSG
jgi:hypothetical protein